MNPRLQVKLIRANNLLPLSLVHATKGVPQPATNEERAQTFRACLPSPKYNTFQWFKPTPRREV